MQVVIDNFDLDMTSPNGKSNTHSLGMILAKDQRIGVVVDSKHEISRIPFKDMNQAIDYHMDVHRYKGPKNPKMLLLHQTYSD